MKNILKNKDGMILVTSYLTIIVLLIMGGVYFTRSIVEIRSTERYVDSAQAFWAAERGLAQAVSDLENGIPFTEGEFINLEEGSDYCRYKIESYDSFTSKVITVTGVAGASSQDKTQKKLQTG